MNRPRNGFTLIELIMIITVLGVLIVIAAPLFTSNDGIEKYTQLRLLRDKIRFATQYNIQTGLPVRMNFISGPGTSKIDIDYKDPGTGWTPLSVAGESSDLHLELGSGDFTLLNITQVNINSGNILLLDALSQPRDQNGNLLISGMNAYVEINSETVLEFQPISAYLELQ